MRAVVVMVAAGWFATATATAWAAAPTAAHAAKAQTAAHKKGHVAITAQHKAHRKGVKTASAHGAKAQAAAKHAGAGVHDPVAASSGHSSAHSNPSRMSHMAHLPRTPRQASAHKPARAAVARPTPRHKLMVDAPAAPSVPSVPSAPLAPAVADKRTNPPPRELPPILG